MRPRRWIATLLAVALGHGVWMTAAMPCAAGGAPAMAEAAAPAEHAAHAAHATHHGALAVGTAVSDAADAAPPAGEAPADECPLLLQCALLLALPSAPPTIAQAPVEVPAVVAPTDTWRDGPALALEPPPPKRR